VAAIKDFLANWNLLRSRTSPLTSRRVRILVEFTDSTVSQIGKSLTAMPGMSVALDYSGGFRLIEYLPLAGLDELSDEGALHPGP
jgi:hypothetical protein